jgi:fluoride exporter
LLYLLIALGSGVGSALRHGLAVLSARKWGDKFPWGTLIVNLSGSLAIGLYLGARGTDSLAAAPPVDQVVALGLLGGYTTLSSFSLQTVALLEAGEARPAAVNILFSMVGSIGAAGLGWWLGALLR